MMFRWGKDRQDPEWAEKNGFSRNLMQLIKGSKAEDGAGWQNKPKDKEE